MLGGGGRRYPIRVNFTETYLAMQEAAQTHVRMMYDESFQLPKVDLDSFHFLNEKRWNQMWNRIENNLNETQIKK